MGTGIFPANEQVLEGGVLEFGDKCTTFFSTARLGTGVRRCEGDGAVSAARPTACRRGPGPAGLGNTRGGGSSQR